jgi:6-phosphogluconolactonase
MMQPNKVKIFNSESDLFHAAVNDFIHQAITTVQNKKIFRVGLSGGNTPKSFFDILSEVSLNKKNLQIPWQKVNFFFSDERYVPIDSSENNYHMAYEHLFSKLQIPQENIYRMPTEGSDPTIAAQSYKATLRAAFGVKENQFPVFDLMYLGLGENAHTASLMPLSEIVKEYCEKRDTANNDQLVASLWVPELNQYRLTLTPVTINHSACIIFMVTGASKAQAVWEVLEGPKKPTQYPAQLIQSTNGKTIWYLDSAAASKLQNDQHF